MQQGRQAAAAGSTAVAGLCQWCPARQLFRKYYNLRKSCVLEFDTKSIVKEDVLC
jgi:hypothetical protein